jgi:NAD(P)-dependent dehydrogenase (short-subunit alcohol dehydrogenase family)
MSNLFDLSGKIAVITGSTRGIGRAIAEEMARHGARVVISSRKQEVCNAVAAELNAEFGDGTATPIAASISDKAQLTDMMARVRAELGPVDILVCNAASNPYYGPMEGISDEQFSKILHNNVISTHWLVQMALPDMRAKNDGAIVIISSIGGLKGSTTIGAYNVSKAADFQLARNYACEYGQHNIRVNCIAPGLIRTDFAKALWDNPAAAEAFNKRHPMRRMGVSRDIAGAAVFLASPAAGYVNGQQIVVDGGMVIDGGMI